jgi:hypothetical protein
LPMTVVPADLRLSAQRALLGAIHPEVRLVKVKLIGSTIVVTTLSEMPLTEEAWQALSSAAGEIIADFPDYQIEEHFVVSADALPYENILEEGWVYQRAEG